MKIIACFILITEFSVSLEKEIEFFNKEIVNF